MFWIFNIIEHLKTYLRDFVYVIDLIKVQLQLKKIYNWVLNLENNIINLKAKIKNLQTKLNSLNNYDRHTGFITCNNVGFLTAGVFGIAAGFSLVFTPLTTIIATISAIGAGLAGSVASLCGIAEQRKL
ncbi:hypothetical protein [Spiroplasma endosymbiont of Seladonia tumulorum]|uniref:hypothetical protein n=1 Tax=Spiroplasma endosymbiont of Seladonia tumulorum TaxID=3066321 RepID=UPI0030CA74E3